MLRDIGRARDGLNAATAPEPPVDAEPEPSIADRALALARSKVPVIAVDPELLRYRHRLDQQLVAWRNRKSTTSLANALAIVAAPQAPRFEWHAPLLWIAAIAACCVAGLAGWWVASAPAVRIGVELAETRQALQQEQDKVQQLGTALAATWSELGDRAAALADKAAGQNQERDALQQALQQSEAAAAQNQERDALQQALQQSEATAANFAQSLAQERDALQQARQQAEAAAAGFAQSLAQERDALQQARQQAEAAAAGFALSLAQERDRNQQFEQQLVARRDAVPEPVRPAAEPTSAKPPTEKADPDLLRLMSRASLLLAQGDIGAARIVLERAVESGSAPALFALAETFDPAVLSAWGTVGTQGDAVRAGDLYARALAGGVVAAKDRLATLRR